MIIRENENKRCILDYSLTVVIGADIVVSFLSAVGTVFGIGMAVVIDGINSVESLVEFCRAK
jgi:hypothetical protein